MPRSAALVALVCGVSALCPAWAGVSPGLTALAGNGQIAFEFQLAPVPLVVRATDANGVPLANVPVLWSITQGKGNLVGPVATTDSSGLAMAGFVATALPDGQSFGIQTITATSPAGTVTFVVTTLVNRVTTGGVTAVPAVQLLAPSNYPPGVTGSSGDTVPAGLQVRLSAFGGPQDGAAIPNVSVRVMDANDPDNPTAAVCANAQGGFVFTDSTGNAACDLKLTGAPGRYSLAVLVGEYSKTARFTASIDASSACTYSLASGSQNFGPAGGSGSISITTSSNCSWTASSSSSWLAITSDTSGLGPGSLSYTVAANAGRARTGAITASGQSLNIAQSSSTSSTPVTITTPSPLPDAITQTPYSITLSATGGKSPYAWSVQGALPAGLALDPSSGIISGTPLSTGAFSFQVTATDAAPDAATVTLAITVQGPGGGVPGSYPAVTNGPFPAGVVGLGYLQTLTSTGGCVNALSPAPGFSITAGTLPPGLAVRELTPGTFAVAGVPSVPGAFGFTVTVTDACDRTGQANFTIAITAGLGTTVPVFVSPASVSFSVQAGDTTGPADQSIAVTSTASLSFTAALITGTGGNWFTIAGSGVGSVPAMLTLHGINYSNLAPGTYASAIAITPLTGGPPLVVPVSLTVAAPAVISATPPVVDLTLPANSGSASAVTQTVNVQGTQTSYSVAIAVQSGGNWLSASKTAGSAPDTFNVTADASTLGPGVYNGSVTVTPTVPAGPSQVIPVTVRVLSAAEVAPIPSSVIVVYHMGDPGPGAQNLALQAFTGVASYAAASTVPWLTVSPTSGSTPATLSLTVNPAGLVAGSYYGSVVILSPAAAGGQMSVPVTLFIPIPKPRIAAVQNAASLAIGPVAPGEAIVIYGSYMGPAFVVAGTVTNGKQNKQAGQTRVLFDGVAAPVLYAREDVVAALVPFSVSGAKPANLQVEMAGLYSDPVAIPTAASAPGIFVDASGNTITLNQDDSLNGPRNGAAPGDRVSVYLTGGGATTPASPDGLIATDASQTLANSVTAQINGKNAQVPYAGNAPGSPAGVSVVQVMLPADLQPGAAATIRLTIGGVSTQSGVTVYIKP